MPDTTNPYEAACERFNDACEAARATKILVALIVREVEDEWEAARTNLAQYELSPGIPLPQYQDGSGASNA